MPWEEARIRAPELEDGVWLSSPPIRMGDLRGHPVLVDFWDYTCVNCIRTLPYLTAWDARYRDHGLTIIGVHAPEFSFARDADLVRRAMADFGVRYPVVLDNDYRIWQAFANRYWPAKYLIDADGVIRYYHFGEGAYQETELAIQRLLTEAGADPKQLPDPLPPVHEADMPGAVCYPVTPETYLGSYRGRPGNAGQVQADRVADYRDPGRHAEGYFYLQGRWLLDAERVVRAQGGEGPAYVALRYTSKEVNAVLNPALDRPGPLVVRQDGGFLPRDHAGGDVRYAEDGTSYVDVTTARMYSLVDNPDVEAHELTLHTDVPGLALYALTFVSCTVAAEP